MNEKITFLNGQLSVRQGEGYRAGLDAVLLASAVRVRPKQSALELGCGAGTALLCAAHLNPDANFTGLEKHKEVLELARQNAQENNLQDRVRLVAGSVFSPPAAFGPDSFDHVFLNPPYFDDAKALREPKKGKDTAFIADQAKLFDWLATAHRLVRPKGFITLVQRADRLDDCLHAFAGKAGDFRILPIAPRAGEAAHRIILRARKNVKTPLTLLPPFIVHEEGRTWTPQAAAVLHGTQRLDLGS